LEIVNPLFLAGDRSGNVSSGRATPHQWMGQSNFDHSKIYASEGWLALRALTCSPQNTPEFRTMTPFPTDEPADRDLERCVNVHDRYDRVYWSNRLGVTEEVLREMALKCGPRIVDIRQALSTSSAEGNGLPKVFTDERPAA